MQLDWRRIAAIDINRVIETVDIDTLQDNLEHISYARLTDQDLLYFQDNSFFIKLFRISQLLVQYLLHVQNYLLSQQQKTEQDSKSRISDLEKQIADLQERAVLREKKIKQLKRSYNNNLNQSMVQGAGAALCEICHSAFRSHEFLVAHYERRHPGRAVPSNAAPIVNQMIKSTPDITNLIKSTISSELQNSIVFNQHPNQMERLQEQLEILHKKQSELQSTMKEQVTQQSKQIESIFNSTMQSSFTESDFAKFLDDFNQTKIDLKTSLTSEVKSLVEEVNKKLNAQKNFVSQVPPVSSSPKAAAIAHAPTNVTFTKKEPFVKPVFKDEQKQKESDSDSSVEAPVVAPKPKGIRMRQVFGAPRPSLSTAPIFRSSEDEEEAKKEKFAADAENKRKEEEKRQEEEKRLNLIAEQEEAKLQAEEEERIAAEKKAKEDAKRKSEEEIRARVAARFKIKEEARKKAIEEARLKAEEEARLQQETLARIEAEEEARHKAIEDARIQAEEDERQRLEEEKRIEAEEEARLKQEAEREAIEAENSRIKAEELRASIAAKIKAKEEARIKAIEDARIAAEEKKRGIAKQSEFSSFDDDSEDEDAKVKAEQESFHAKIKAKEDARLKAVKAEKEKSRLDEELEAKIIDEEFEAKRIDEELRIAEELEEARLKEVARKEEAEEKRRLIEEAERRKKEMLVLEAEKREEDRIRRELDINQRANAADAKLDAKSREKLSIIRTILEEHSHLESVWAEMAQRRGLKEFSPFPQLKFINSAYPMPPSELRPAVAESLSDTEQMIADEEALEDLFAMAEEEGQVEVITAFDKLIKEHYEPKKIDAPRPITPMKFKARKTIPVVPPRPTTVVKTNLPKNTALVPAEDRVPTFHSSFSAPSDASKQKVGKLPPKPDDANNSSDDSSPVNNPPSLPSRPPPKVVHSLPKPPVRRPAGQKVRFSTEIEPEKPEAKPENIPELVPEKPSTFKSQQSSQMKMSNALASEFLTKSKGSGFKLKETTKANDVSWDLDDDSDDLPAITATKTKPSDSSFGTSIAKKHTSPAKSDSFDLDDSADDLNISIDPKDVTTPNHPTVSAGYESTGELLGTRTLPFDNTLSPKKLDPDAVQSFDNDNSPSPRKQKSVIVQKPNNIPEDDIDFSDLDDIEEF